MRKCIKCERDIFLYRPFFTNGKESYVSVQSNTNGCEHEPKDS